MFSDILYSTNFIRYCLSVICNFFLYLNFSTFQTFFVLILFIRYSWSSALMQIISQYKIFVLIFWLLKLRLLRRNAAKNSLTEVLTVKTSIIFYRFSFINHLLIRMNHWSQFLWVRIEMSCCFIKKSLKFIVMIVDT